MPMRRENVAAALRYLQDKADLRGRLQRATSLDPQEQDLADIAVETGASLVPGVGPALAARDFERARRADDEAGMAMAAAGAIPGGKLAKLLKGFDPTRLELDVYHGTPHRFPATEANPLGEFDASKIGTGEGAQAYGHGIYYAENPNVAKGYQSTLRQTNAWEIDGQRVHGVRSRSDAQPINYAANALERFDGDKKAAIAWLKDSESPWDLEAAQLLAKSKTAQKAPGSLYKADLPDEMIDRMLDWDKPLSEQPAAVRNAFNDLLDETGNYQSLGIGGTGNLSGSDAADLYNDLKGMWNENYGPDDLVNIDAPSASAAVSEFLRRRGILGIKYADAGSRGQGGSGTRNFVVFPGEEKKVRILERK